MVVVVASFCFHVVFNRLFCSRAAMRAPRQNILNVSWLLLPCFFSSLLFAESTHTTPPLSLLVVQLPRQHKRHAQEQEQHGGASPAREAPPRPAADDAVDARFPREPKELPPLPAVQRYLRQTVDAAVRPHVLPLVHR